MAKLSLTLLGLFRAWTESGQYQPLRTVKERLLLSYLAVEHGRTHRRETLAELFWPDSAESVARNSLRQALFGLRLAMDSKAFDDFCTVTTHDVLFHMNQHVWLDVVAFGLHYEAVQNHQHVPGEPCSYCFQHLYDAAELYRGDFLSDIWPEKAPALQSWILQQRERYRQQQMSVLDQLSHMFSWMGDPQQAARCVERQAALDPTNEALHRRWMLLVAGIGQNQVALDIYHSLNRRLTLQNDQSLDPQTVYLAERIRRGQVEPLQPREIFHTLPAQLTRFFGREIDISRLTRALEDPQNRLFSVVGPGGVGKTRYAIEAAQMLLKNFPDGVYFVPVENVRAPENLPEAIARCLGFVPNRQEDTIAALISGLERRRALLLLDNFEQLVEARNFLLMLLKEAPNLKILVTSRERLHLQAEFLIEIEGLPYLIREGSNELPPAIRLFIERAQRSRPAMATSAEEQLADPVEREAVEKICALVDGLPLAIELAASWANEYSYAQIAQEIAHNAEFLRSTMLDLPERQRSLWASFEHSWNLLTETEQEVFCRLSVFPGRFGVQAAQEVSGAAFPWLVSLVEQSMVRRVGFGRYDLHPFLRQYAEQKLVQFSRKTEQATRMQHAQFFCSWIGNLEADIQGQSQLEALRQVDVEIENVLTGWMWAADHAEVEMQFQARVGLFYYLDTRSRWRDGLACYERAAERLRRVEGDRARRMLAYALACQGWFSCRLSQFEEAQKLLQESIECLPDEENGSEKTFTHFAFGFLMLWRSQFVAAVQHLSIGLETARQIQDLWAMAWTSQFLTEIAAESGQEPFSEEKFQQRLQAFEKVGDLRGIARVLNYLGNIAMFQERYLQADQYFQRMLTDMEELGDLWGAAGGYGKLGQLAIARGEYQAAETLLQKALVLFRRTGDRRREAYVLGDLGETSAALGDPTRAETFFASALDTALSTRSLALAQDIFTSAARAAHRGSATRIAVELLGWVVSLPISDRLTYRRAMLLLKQLGDRGDAPATGGGSEQDFWNAAEQYRSKIPGWHSKVG